MAANMLEIRDACKEFRIGGMILGTKIMAVDHVSLALPGDRAWIMSIVGESGSGKTTLARMILTLLELSAGEILVNGRTLSSYSKDKKSFYKDVQPIFQNPFTAFSAKRTVDAYLYETALNLDVAGSRDEAKNIITTILNRVGLEYDHVVGKYPNQFSGGELQRISIARALITRPKIIVADEPVAMIDASLRMNIVNIFKSLKEEFGVSFVYITHDLSTAYYVSDYIATMYKGAMIEFGAARRVLEEPGHPYTELLLDSVPKVGARWTETDTIRMEDAEEKGAAPGCKFAKRCPYAKEICSLQVPPMVEINDQHRLLCFKFCGYTMPKPHTAIA